MSSVPCARVYLRHELVERLQAVVEFTITAKDMARFAELSGDFNPLHTDEEFARSKGFEGVVVYGALLVAKVSQLIGMQLPGRDSIWASVSLEFRKPLYVGELAHVQGVVAEVSESTGLLLMNITIRSAGKLLAKGSAEVVMVAETENARKWFLVSGGSGGIGAAVCDALAARGYAPVVAYHRNAAAAEAVATRCGGCTLSLDLGDEGSIMSAVRELEQLPTLAGVVLAGSPPLSLVPFGKISADEMQQQWQVNVMGPQKLMAELVRRCLRKHKNGAVVGVLTRAMGDGTHGAASGMGAYVIGKYGMAGMLAVLAADYPWLRVRSVKPGYTETRMLEAFDERFLATQREMAPFQTPAQIASLIVEEALDP